MWMKLRSYIGSRFWGRTFAEGSLRTWMHEEVVRKYINESVTGSPGVWPTEWLQTRVRSPFRAAVSIGCGEGALERDLLSKGLCTSILGIDLSMEALGLAESKAAEQGLAGARYEQGDMNALRLPASVRRSRHLKLPVDWRDPTEAVRSSEIPAALSRHFEILERHDYGGNFLSVIHPHLRLDLLTAPERAGLLQSIIDAEREHLAAGHRSYYMVALARRQRSQGSASGAGAPPGPGSPRRAGGPRSRRSA